MAALPLMSTLVQPRNIFALTSTIRIRIDWVLSTEA
jgi:hypothetical protein